MRGFLVQNLLIPSPKRLAEFITGERCFFFFINIKKSKRTKLGEVVQLKFVLAQYVKDEFLIINLIKYLYCEIVHNNIEAFVFQVAKFLAIENKIILFLSQGI